MVKPKKIQALQGARRYFDDFIQKQPELAEPPLPLTHVTDAYDLRDIVRDGEIRPHYCEILEETLAYCNYGRPAYRKNGSAQANDLAAYAPIVLILSSNLCDDAALAFPFDSGAFKGEKYSDLTHHKMRVEDFGLNPSFDKLGKLVAFFFGSNKRYYDQRPVRSVKVPKSEYEVDVYSELVAFRGKNERDDRSKTIEIIFDHALKLKGNLLALVVPGSLLTDGAYKAKLKALDVDILPYTDGANLTPASQIPRLIDVVRQFYFRKNILK